MVAGRPAEFKYGPYWRVEKDMWTSFKIQNTGILRGRPPRNFKRSDIPAVEAYSREPSGKKSIKFYTKYPPDPHCIPGAPVWRDWSTRNKGEVREVTINGEEFAEIDVFVVSNLHDRRKNQSGPINGNERRKDAINT